MLEQLDAVQPGEGAINRVFSVFSIPPPPPSSYEDHLGSHHGPEEHHSSSTVRLADTPYTSSGISGVTPHSFGDVHNSTREFDEFLADAGTQHELLECWTTQLCGFMTPIPVHDNIFTNIITPLAMKATEGESMSRPHLSLLHAVLAMTTFWRGNFSGSNDLALGRRYLNSSLKLLKQCLECPEDHHVILAAISTLLIIPAFIGEDSVWRIHMCGGIAWLQSVDAAVWTQSASSSVLLQLFAFYEALCPVSTWTKPADAHSPGDAFELDLATNQEWHLDKVLGITRAITECIRQINVFMYSATGTQAELDDLELKIYRSDPMGSSFQGLNKDCAELAQQHALLYYTATRLYFSRCLRHVTIDKVQHMVRATLGPMRYISAVEEKRNVSGILWPYFIIACEAQDTETRLAVMRHLDHRQYQGVGNSDVARRAILSVWTEREDRPRSESTWVDIIAREGFDLLLL